MSQEQFYQTVQMQQEYEMKSWVEQYLDEEANVEYCPYCMSPRGGKRSCCGEVHFMPLGKIAKNFAESNPFFCAHF